MAAGKLLLIDDDQNLTSMMKQVLEEEGYEVQVALNGMEGLRRLYQWRPDLVILDVVMPGMDGWSACQRIREVSEVPVLMLSIRDGDSNELKGLQVGADQYMSKPFSMAVLLARVEALLRRSRLTPSSVTHDATLAIRDLRIDLAKHEVSLEGKQIDLSPTEFRLLVALAAKPGFVMTHKELLTRVWGPEYAEEDLYLKLYVRYLRQKIEKDPSDPRYILTKRGVGYYLSDGGGGGGDDGEETNGNGNGSGNGRAQPVRPRAKARAG